ncbi:MAG: sulfoxide reductase heme-binding subunit YedZ [Burkholderiaceae bacterium]|nr:sulfoxide reductase heme-binding subunit YedZ [Burkholderiaceae bacterium]
MASADKVLLHPAAKPAVFLVALLPFAHLLAGVFTHGLGPNPAEALIRGLGDWTLRFLCLTLAVTPIRQWTLWHALARYRRMLGLFMFFYAAMHLLAYAWFDMGFEWIDIGRDIGKRPFILVGMLSMLLLLPLAATSMNAAVRALGARRWQWLHRLVYVIAPLAILHFFWMRAAKNNFAEVWIYATVLALLLGWRLWRAVGPRYRMKLGSHSARG